MRSCSISASSIDRSNFQPQSAVVRRGFGGLSAARKSQEQRHRLTVDSSSVEATGDLGQRAKAMYAMYKHELESELVTQSALII